ncbi:hypothetical protein PAPHI01_2784 [Pancytospora philotis]|nr:hypothetical protein PAPHI01_2784 [Pancytospora philotis]
MVSNTGIQSVQKVYKCWSTKNDACILLWVPSVATAPYSIAVVWLLPATDFAPFCGACWALLRNAKHLHTFCTKIAEKFCKNFSRFPLNNDVAGPLMRRISHSIRNEVREMFARGLSLRSIAQSTGISVTSVHNITADIPHETRIVHMGRPHIVTERMMHILTRAVEAPRALSLQGLRNILFSATGVLVSRSTIRNILRAHGLVNRVRPLKPRLTARHKKGRLGFARATIGYPERAWQNVVFTDECTVCAKTFQVLVP